MSHKAAASPQLETAPERHRNRVCRVPHATLSTNWPIRPVTCTRTKMCTYGTKSGHGQMCRSIHWPIRQITQTSNSCAALTARGSWSLFKCSCHIMEGPALEISKAAYPHASLRAIMFMKSFWTKQQSSPVWAYLCPRRLHAPAPLLHPGPRCTRHHLRQQLCDARQLLRCARSAHGRTHRRERWVMHCRLRETAMQEHQE